jgi:hypothetical protein
MPSDAIDWFRGIFAEANRRVTQRLVNVPNIRETSLDDGLIECLIPDTAPLLLPSGAIVRMDAHNIGGLRRIAWPPWDGPDPRRWETADIAILVFVYRKEKLIAKKIGLLQSKRLYPENNDVEDDDQVGFMYGMNAFLRKDNTQAIGALHREFKFNDGCIYGALTAGSHQTSSIDKFNEKFGPSVYYLFYNPHFLPITISYPVHERVHIQVPEIGCRVFDAASVHKVLASLNKDAAPSYQTIQVAADSSNWQLEVWASDLLLSCKVGQQFDDTRDADVRYLLERRSGPIGAALAVSIILPEL